MTLASERPNNDVEGLVVLDAYIIQEIKKEEAKRREVERRPRLHIERPAPPWPKREERDADSEDEEESEEAVIRIDMTA